MLPIRLRSDAAKIKQDVVDVNSSTIPDGDSVKALDKLLCKRVSVDIVKLSPERPTNRQKPTAVKKKKKNTGYNKKSNFSRKKYSVSKKKNNAIQKKNSAVKKTLSVVKHTNGKLHNVSSLLKTEWQPFVQLHRIDNVFNKIAQSLAKSSVQGEQKNKVQGDQKNKVSPKVSQGVSPESTKEVNERIVQEEPKDINKVCKESVAISVETQTINDPMINDVKESRIEFVNDNDSDSDESVFIFSRSRRYNDSDDNEGYGKPKPKRMRIDSYTSDEEDTDADMSMETSVLNEPLNSDEKDIDVTMETPVLNEPLNSSEDLNEPIKSDVQDEEQVNQELQVNQESQVNEESQVNQESQVNVDSFNPPREELDDSRDTVLMEIKEEEELIIFDEISTPVEIINIRDICPKDLTVSLIRFDDLKQFDKKYSAMEVEKAIEDYMNPSSLSEAKFEDEMMEPPASPELSNLSFYERVLSGMNISTEATPERSRVEKTPERSCTPPTEKTPEKSCETPAEKPVVNHSPDSDWTPPGDGDFMEEVRLEMICDCTKIVRMCAPNGTYTGSVVDLLKPHSPAAMMACFKSPSPKKLRRKRKRFTTTPDESDEATEAEDAGSQETNSPDWRRCRHRLELDSPEKKHPEGDSITNKCIVCDTKYPDFETLRRHLSVHTNKSNSTSCVPQEESLEIPEEPPLVIETPEEPAETSEPNDLPEPEVRVKDGKGKAKSPRRVRSPRKKKTEKKKNENEKTLYEACSVCSQVFHDRQNLTAHFFLHPEKECHSAYQQQLMKDTKLPKDKNHKKSKESLSLKISEPRTISPEEMNEMKSANKTEMNDNCENAQDRIMPQTSASASGLLDLRIPAKESDQPGTSRDSSEAPEASKKPEETLPTEPQKPETDTNTKKRITLCECHSNLEPNITDLGIEIVLLCQVCRTLFRSLNCFKKHYDKPQYSACKLSEKSQSPYLFCVPCGKVFNSADNLRHHLETHYSKSSCTTDFRCNICKVMFYGIGSLFYTHWASHSRNPYWVGNEQSFPDESVVRLPSFNNLLIDGYITVAEYQCTKCKDVFATGGELKTHVENCSCVTNSRLKILCNLCDVTYSEKSDFFKHVRNTHNLCGDPQLTVNGSTITCNICNADTMNLKDFDNHWLKHLMTHTTFTCNHCRAEFEDDLEMFVEHAKMHRLEEMRCSVHYTSMDHICERCYIGFRSRKMFREHMNTHDEEPSENNRPGVSSKEDFLEPGSVDAQGKPNIKIDIDTEDLPQKLDRELVIDLTKEEPEEEQQPAPEAPSQNEETRISGNESASGENEKPRMGFLRVKTLQELTGTPFNCKTCGCSFKTADELSSHEKLHEKPATNGSSSSKQENAQLNNVIGVVVRDKNEESMRNAYNLRLLVNDLGVCREIPLRTDLLQVSQQSKQSQQPQQSRQSQQPQQSEPSQQCQQPQHAKQPQQYQQPTQLKPSQHQQPQQSIPSQQLQQSQQTKPSQHQQLQQSNQSQHNQQPQQSKSSQLYQQPTQPQQLQQPSLSSQLKQQTVAAPRVESQNLNKEQSSSSSSPIGYHRNLPFTNIIRKSKAIPRSAILKKDGTMYRCRPMTVSQPPNLTRIQPPSLTPIQQPLNLTQIQPPSLTQIPPPSLTPIQQSNLPTTRPPTSQPTEPASRQPNQPKTLPSNRQQTEPKTQPPSNQSTHPVIQPPSYTQPKTQEPSQPLASENERLLINFFFVIDSNNPQAKFRCKFCGFRSSSQFECVKHSDPGSEAPCKVKYSQIQPQGQGNVAGSYNKQVRQPSSSPGSNASFVTSYTVGNSSGGSMAIVINQPAATGLQEVPTFGILQTTMQPQTETDAQAEAQAQIYQQQIYQPQVYQPQVYQQEPQIYEQQQLYEQQPQLYEQQLYEQPQLYEQQQQLYENSPPLFHANPMAIVAPPYLQQSQNVVIRSNNVRQVRRDQVPNGEAVTTCEVRLRPTMFICSHCSKRSRKTFGSEILLQEHVRTKHNFVCMVCRERFYSREVFAVHKTKHGKAKENVVSQL